MARGRVPKAKTIKGKASIPKAPAYLDDLAAEEFDKLTAVLAESGNLAKTDAKLIEVYAANYSLLVRAVTELGVSPLVFTGDKGRAFINPLIAVVHNSTQKIRQVIGDLGLSPSSAKQVADNLPSIGSAAGWDEFVED
jgi:P27 family predicted phage terminase small subunit